MMSVNSRSVLRPEYLGHTSYMASESCYSNILDKRYNTNTAPVYPTNSLNPMKGKPSRRLNHPYIRPERLSSRLRVGGSKNHFSCSNYDHPANRLGISPVSLKSYGSSSDSDTSPPKCSYGSKPSSESVCSVRYPRKGSPLPKKEEYSTARSYTHGQAEQIRRSRESTTFALIDAQLSRPPLNQVRDMYLQNRSGSGTSNNSSAARTTKKVNLSVVHTVVRFRVKEYLREVQEHVKRLLDALFGNMFEHYDPSMRSTLASQLFGIPRLPCTSDCQFCPELLQCGRKSHQSSRNETRSRLSHTGFSPFHNYTRPYSTCSSNTSNTPVLSTSDGPSESHDFSPSNKSPEVPIDAIERVPSPKLQFSDSVLSSDEAIQSSHRDTLSERNSVLEKPLLSYHVGPDCFPPKYTRRTRLDSTSLRLVNEFDTIDWSAEHIDLGPFNDEPVDLHTLVSDAMDPMGLRPEESFFDPAYDPIDLIHQFSIDKYPGLTLSSSP
ncbi:hypothetical protein FGIG_04881 [Fasciola gigantica]|uniref:Uncharacterized protein n=1 Tax=Fasciola gigantica TaxID=46835 RepID=A0A504YBZ3_FASGI|nr:hypothetical protein FGIG_04881 [Fasciola gigantica]